VNTVYDKRRVNYHLNDHKLIWSDLILWSMRFALCFHTLVSVSYLNASESIESNRKRMMPLKLVQLLCPSLQRGRRIRWVK
jgi:hypothetical protein